MWRGKMPDLFINSRERAAAISCIDAGRSWGYGNMMCRLSRAWALKLIEDGMDILPACLMARISQEEAEAFATYSKEDIIASFRRYTGVTT
jgi:hypothetical protein